MKNVAWVELAAPKGKRFFLITAEKFALYLTDNLDHADFLTVEDKRPVLLGVLNGLL